MENSVRLIFVMLGFKCNMNCVYCLQHDLVKSENIEKNIHVSKKTLYFIHKYAKESVDKEKKKPLQVRFFGGEPLLYFSTIKEIVKDLKNEQIDFSIVTNGSLLTEEIVEFINSNNIGIGLSWDGNGTDKTRFYNVIKNKKDLVLKLNRITISGVISKYNYIDDFLKEVSLIDEEYFKIHKYHLSINMDLIMIFDKNPKSLDLIDFDYDKMKQQSEHMCNIFLNTLGDIRDKNYPYFSYMSSRILQNASTEKLPDIPKCGNGVTMFNIDLNGNMYFCHNDSKKMIGKSDDSYCKLNKNAQQFITDEKVYNEKCKNCNIRQFCGQGCTMFNNWQRDLYYCKLSKAIYEPILNMLDKLLITLNTLSDEEIYNVTN